MNSYRPSAERPADIEKMRAQIRGVPYRPTKGTMTKQRPLPSTDDCHRLFNIERGSRWLDLARREPEAKQLFGELWYQNELCMMFADTNIGKSVLAVQIGESIARGQGVGPFACRAKPERVAYFDFELTRRQFLMRYSKNKEDYRFSDNFYRAEFNFVDDLSPDVDENELLIAAIEYKINSVNAKVLILDNITCLRGGTENSTVALSLMKSLKALKTANKLSILVLAHTPKRRNSTRPISADDLHGSKMLVNFADSAFALGKSGAEAGLCYLKQIKQRNTSQRYGEDNVCLCRIQKPGTFLQFKFEGYSAERHHLLSRTAAERLQLADQVVSLYAAGFSQRAIAKQLAIGLATVNKWLHDGGGCNPDKPHDAVAQACNTDSHGNLEENVSADVHESAYGTIPNSNGKYAGEYLNDGCTVKADEFKESTPSENYDCTDTDCSPPDKINEEEDAEFEEDMDEEDEIAEEYIFDGTNGPLPGLWPDDDDGPRIVLKPGVGWIYKTTQIDEKPTPELLERLREIAEFTKSIEIVKCDGTSEPFVPGKKPGDYP
jgi:transposase-like protein/archaellum biogenesis ATPase FlaH